MRENPRPRREIAAPTALLVRPFFRFSHSRHAFILRGIGHRAGPVLVISQSGQGRVEVA